MRKIAALVVLVSLLLPSACVSAQVAVAAPPPYVTRIDPETYKLLPWRRALPLGASLELFAPPARCSAVALGPHLAATAAHCLDPVPQASALTLLDWTGHKHKVASFLIHQTKDVALLEVIEPLTDQAAIAIQAPGPGDMLFLSGWGCWSQLDVRPVVYLGAFKDHTIFFEGSVCHGDSGGPVFNDRGELVGLTKFTAEDLPLGGATETQAIMELLQ